MLVSMVKTTVKMPNMSHCRRQPQQQHPNRMWVSNRIQTSEFWLKIVCIYSAVGIVAGRRMKPVQVAVWLDIVDPSASTKIGRITINCAARIRWCDLYDRSHLVQRRHWQQMTPWLVVVVQAAARKATRNDTVGNWRKLVGDFKKLLFYLATTHHS